MPPMPPGGSETVLGADVTFKGECAYEGAMRIEGKFDGKITSKGRLAIGKTAHVSGEVTVGLVNVEGVFKGNVASSEKIELAASAQMTGDVRAPKLVVAEGATLVGNVVVSPDALKGAGSVERDAILSGHAPQPAPAVRR
ncbi:MAG: polymer-forming cytoskeletal protein [Planctomycetes bacterium]|nr:polymer-forming cytoskeletal protein [Planctomycetota bacterium]